MKEYVELINNLGAFINNNIAILLVVIASFILIKLVSKTKIKKTNYKKVEKGFFNTGFKTSTSFYDIFKFKLRINDYDDKLGVNYIYLFAIKIFNWEICKTKYKNQKGQILKRNIKFGSVL